MSGRTYLDYITLPCKASLVITNVYGQGSWPCITIDGRRCHAELVAPDVHPLMGISTSGTILSSLSSYTSRSIKSPIPRWASRWLRLQRRPRAHQSEPASAGKSISVSPLALLSYTHPRRRPTPVRRTSMSLYQKTGASRFQEIRHRKKIYEGIILPYGGEWQHGRSRYFSAYAYARSIYFSSRFYARAFAYFHSIRHFVVRRHNSMQRLTMTFCTVIFYFAIEFHI